MFSAFVFNLQVLKRKNYKINCSLLKNKKKTHHESFKDPKDILKKPGYISFLGIMKHIIGVKNSLIIIGKTSNFLTLFP